MEPNIKDEELIVLLQSLQTSIQKGLGGQQDLGAEVNRIDGRLEFLLYTLNTQIKQLREEFVLSSTSTSARITEIDRQVGILQDNQKRIETQICKDEKDEKDEENSKSDSLGTNVVRLFAGNPTLITTIVVFILAFVAWGTALIEHHTGKTLKVPSYPSLEERKK